MSAVRVVTDHQELDNSGEVTHSSLDAYVNTTPWLLVSGVSGPVPPSARMLKLGAGITVVDGGPGGYLTISVSGSSLPTPASEGQILMNVNGSPAWRTPVVSETNGWLVNNNAELLVVE